MLECTIAITLLNYWVQYKTGNFSTRLATVSFSSNTVVVGISGYIKIIQNVFAVHPVIL